VLWQCAASTQKASGAPSVHSPRPRPIEYAQVSSTQSPSSPQFVEARYYNEAVYRNIMDMLATLERTADALAALREGRITGAAVVTVSP